MVDGVSSLDSSVARARWSALFTEATLVSSSSATSAAFQRSTSHRMSTARWRGGSCCSAATKASRTDSRAPTMSAGSPSGTTRPSGIGSIQSWSGVRRFSTIGSPGRSEVHRARASLARVEHVEADVRRDAIEPRAQRGSTLEALVAAPRPDEGLLHGVLRVDRSEHPVAVRGELHAIVLELLLEREVRASSTTRAWRPC